MTKLLILFISTRVDITLKFHKRRPKYEFYSVNVNKNISQLPKYNKHYIYMFRKF